MNGIQSDAWVTIIEASTSSIIDVPEPGVITLLAIGIVGLSALRLRMPSEG